MRTTSIRRPSRRACSVRRIREAAAAALLAAIVPALVPTATAAQIPDPLCGNEPLEILLTNDDGFEAPGIRALRTAFEAAGHRVTLAAPDRNASGSSMAFSWGSVRVASDAADPGAFSVGGTPATAVVLAATALYPAGHRPDLVVSGINNGPNAGALLALSGTVGAALAATLLLDPPIPAFAVSAARIAAAEPAEAAVNRAHLEAVAGHMTRLIAASRSWFCEAGKLVRPRNVLNVNYPARAVADLAGTRVAQQGTVTDLRIVFEQSGPGEFTAQAGRSDPADEDGSDRHWLDAGYVTVTPIGAALEDGTAPGRALDDRLRRIDAVPAAPTVP